MSPLSQSSSAFCRRSHRRSRSLRPRLAARRSRGGAGAPPSPDVAAPGHEGIVVLHIGDSHTAADIFTGRIRDLLEDRYGAGGVLLPPGTPQAGVRSNVFRIEASPGWTYERVRASERRSRFWLSGFTAEARARGESMSFTAYRPMEFTAIDVAFRTQADGGAVEKCSWTASRSRPLPSTVARMR